MRYKDEVLRVLDTMNNDLQILIKAVEEKKITDTEALTRIRRVHQQTKFVEDRINLS
jgi:hypothetical protein